MVAHCMSKTQTFLQTPRESGVGVEPFPLVNPATAVLDNCSLSRNIFGSIRVELGSAMEVKNSKLYNHSHTMAGGAFFVSSNSSLHLSTVLCEGNSANNFGGALFTDRNCSITIDNCIFINNEAH